jgi:hypothetical protein
MRSFPDDDDLTSGKGITAADEGHLSEAAAAAKGKCNAPIDQQAIGY